MKKLSFLGLCLLTAFAASAQNNLVKEVERTIKGGGVNYAEARAQIAPALTNEESKKLAEKVQEMVIDSVAAPEKKSMLHRLFGRH